MQIYDNVLPMNNMLRKMNELVDFSFVNKELKGNFCLDIGRNAIDPIRMFKYLLLRLFTICLMLILLSVQNMTCRLSIF